MNLQLPNGVSTPVSANQSGAVLHCTVNSNYNCSNCSACVPHERSPLAPLIPLFLLQPLDVQLGSPEHVGHLGLHGKGRRGAQGVSRWRCVRGGVRRAGGETRHTASQRLIHRLALQQLRPERHQRTTFISCLRPFVDRTIINYMRKLQYYLT